MALGGIAATPSQTHNTWLRLGAWEELFAAGDLFGVDHRAVTRN